MSDQSTPISNLPINAVETGGSAENDQDIQNALHDINTISEEVKKVSANHEGSRRNTVPGRPHGESHHNQNNYPPHSLSPAMMAPYMNYNDPYSLSSLYLSMKNEISLFVVVFITFFFSNTKMFETMLHTVTKTVSFPHSEIIVKSIMATVMVVFLKARTSSP
jgi:hypothetical protein